MDGEVIFEHFIGMHVALSITGILERYFEFEILTLTLPCVSSIATRVSQISSDEHQAGFRLRVHAELGSPYLLVSTSMPRHSTRLAVTSQ